MEINNSYGTNYALPINFAVGSSDENSTADNGKIASIPSSGDTVSISEQAMAMSNSEMADSQNSKSTEDKSTLTSSNGSVDTVALGVVASQNPAPEVTRTAASQDKVTISQQALALAAEMTMKNPKIENTGATPDEQKGFGDSPKQDKTPEEAGKTVSGQSTAEDANVVAERIQELMQRMQEIMQEMAKVATDEKLSAKEKETKQVQLQTELQAIQIELAELNKQQAA